MSIRIPTICGVPPAKGNAGMRAFLLHCWLTFRTALISEGSAIPESGNLRISRLRKSLRLVKDFPKRLRTKVEDHEVLIEGPSESHGSTVIAGSSGSPRKKKSDQRVKHVMNLRHVKLRAKDYCRHCRQTLSYHLILRDIPSSVPVLLPVSAFSTRYRTSWL